MKKLLIICAMMLMAIGANAQDGRWFVRGGAGVSFMDVKGDSDNMFAYRLGVGYDYRVSQLFSIEPSLMWASKGASKERLNYLELPVQGVFHIGNTFAINVGPYLAVGVSGTDSFFKESKITNRFDLGGTLGVRWYLGKIALGIEESYGFINTVKDYKSKNVSTLATITYFFN